MAQVRFTNNAKTLLDTAINSSITTVVVTDGTVLPALTGGDWFYLTLEDNLLNREIVKVTARSVNTLTVVRGQDGTSAASWAAGVKAENRLTNAAISEIAASVAGLTPTSAFLALVDDTTNAAMLTTLGISSFAQTLLDDTTAGAFMTTLGMNANAQTWLATPSSANLLAAVTDETGTGLLVFGTSPSLTTPTIAGATISGAWTGSHSIVGTTTLQQSGGNFQFHIDNGANTKQISSWFSSSDDQWNLQPRSAGSLVSSKAINYNFTSGLWVIPSASLTTPTIAGATISGTWAGAATWSGVQSFRGGGSTIPAVGASTGAAIFASYSSTFGLLMGARSSDGAGWIQAQKVNGDADAYPLLLNPNGGQVQVGSGGLAIGSDIVMTRGATETITGAKVASGIWRFGSQAAQSNALLSNRGRNNAFEFGHTNTNGYGSTLGAESGSGRPFLAFHGEHGTNTSTYLTRGIKASIFRSDNGGGFAWSTVASTSADNQSPVDLMTLSTAGALAVSGSLSVSGAGVPVVVNSTNNAYSLSVNYQNTTGGYIGTNTSTALVLADATTSNTLTIAGGLSTFNKPVTLGGGANISPGSGGQLQLTGSGYTGFITMDGTAMYTGHNSGSRNYAVRLAGNNEMVLYPSGVASFRGNVQAPDFVISSDETLKKDFTPFTGALDIVRQLRTGEYTRISTGKREYGFMAQDFERAGVPLFVDNTTSTKSLKYPRTPALLAAAIKELLLRVEALETRLAS